VLQQAMTRGAGVLRSAASLAGVAATLGELAVPGARPNTASWEATNLLTVATALVGAATLREETRGCHWREDFPEASPRWLGHLLAALTDTYHDEPAATGFPGAGRLTETWEALP